jgi:hypothetical protein
LFHRSPRNPVLTQSPKPTLKGKRVVFSGPKRTVIDGPFTESKELIAGYWIWQNRRLRS